MYNHPKFSDRMVKEAKTIFKKFRERYEVKAAIGFVAKEMRVSYSDASSMIATKYKEEPMDLKERVRACFDACMRESRTKSKSFVIMDVSDRMRLSCSTIEKILDEDVQLELF